jgi:FAD:protein FMN transferase
MTTMQVERFAAMGSRVEFHLFGGGDPGILVAARQAVEAVDAALTIHRPSPTTALNDLLLAGSSAAVDDPVLLEALAEVEAGYSPMLGLFDPAADPRFPGSAWTAISFDRGNARITAERPLALDFGGFGKGFALDRAGAVLRAGGVSSALLSAGESSIAVIGGHPLGGGWPLAIPHPLREAQILADIEILDQALSISSTVGGGTAAPGRAAMVRPTDASLVTAPCCTVAIQRSGARAEMLSTALLVADEAQVQRLTAGGGALRFCFAASQEKVAA